MQNFERETFDDIALITVNIERATVQYTDEFKSFIKTAFAEGYTKIIIDFGTIQFMDSSFIGSLVNILKDLRTQNGHLRLCNFSIPVLTMFELTRMNRVFDILPTIDKAVQTLRKIH